MKITIISGRSGAGKSVCLRFLEDCGYYCIDNLPLSMLHHLPNELPDVERAAISIDARNLQQISAQDLSQWLNYWHDSHEIELWFLDARDEVLIRRFRQTHRQHPLQQLHGNLEPALHAESELLSPLMEHCTHYIDTSDYHMPALQAHLQQRLAASTKGSLQVHLMSFGYKHGLPADADFIFDARWLPNPYWQEELRAYTGLDACIQSFLADEPYSQFLISTIEQIIEQLMIADQSSKRFSCNIAIGCTGGQHRSVFIVDTLLKNLGTHQTLQVSAIHRDLI